MNKSTFLANIEYTAATEVWDLAAGRALVKLQPSRGFQGSAVAWDPEGEHLFGGFSDGAIYVTWRSEGWAFL